MKKTIVLYANRNVGVNALMFLVAKGYEVKVITEDWCVKWTACVLGCKLVRIEHMGYFDLFICIHGRSIIDKEYLVEDKMINIHPCLSKYKGHNPIKRYIENKDTNATVESQWLIEEVDAGEVIHVEKLSTPICNTYADFYNIAFVYYHFCLQQTLELLNI